MKMNSYNIFQYFECMINYILERLHLLSIAQDIAQDFYEEKKHHNRYFVPVDTLQYRLTQYESPHHSGVWWGEWGTRALVHLRQVGGVGGGRSK